VPARVKERDKGTSARSERRLCSSPKTRTVIDLGSNATRSGAQRGEGKRAVPRP